ncbi:MAG TPA: magnesium transporter [Micromonosporaceae bacterium]|nr:magnesium transporter [Micromonosporaceae bacterium]
MPTVTRVFIARLAGLPVYDPNGDQVGRIRDAVARLRSGGAPPQVVGFVAEMPLRRQIFLPISRVISVDSGSVVLNSGIINLRRFQQGPTELLVLAQLLDRRVTTPTETTATVVDVAMESERPGQWQLGRVAVQESAGRLGRRGQLRQFDWSDLTGLVEPSTSQGTETLLTVLEKLRPADLAHAVQELPVDRRHAVAAALDDERLADMLEELPERQQVEILARLDHERAADVLEEMDADDAADLLAELPPQERQLLLDLMTPEESAPVRALMKYRPGTAGAVMTSEPVILTPDATVADALARIREPHLSPALAAQVFVARAPVDTPTGRYLGAVHFQRLLREPPSDLLGGVLDNDIDPLSPERPLPEITRRMATYNLVAMPVVDENDRLVGAVTVDDLLDHLLPSDWREHHD